MLPLFLLSYRYQVIICCRSWVCLLCDRVSLLSEILKTLQLLHPSIHQLQLLYFLRRQTSRFRDSLKIHFHLEHPQAYRSPAWIIDYQKYTFRLSSLVKSLKNHAFQGRRLPRIKICSWSFGKIFREIWLFIRLKYQKSMIASWFLVFDIRKRAGKLPFLPTTAIRQMIFGFNPVRHDKT